MQIVKSVNFGVGKTGLSTVGYRLLNPDRSVKLARTIVGVSELVAGTGIYVCDINFEDDWRGLLVWDTGDASPLYAEEDYNYQVYGGAVAIVVGP
jgi:hypothetical protein